MLISEEDFVQLTDIAEKLGVSVTAIRKRYTRHPEEFPPPFKVVNRSPIWYWPDVETYFKLKMMLDSKGL